MRDFREKGAGMRDQTLKEEFKCRQLFWERNRDSVTLTIIVSAFPYDSEFFTAPNDYYIVTLTYIWLI